MRKLSIILALSFLSTAAFAESFEVSKQKQCGNEWKLAKADEAVKSAGWPKFWSECSKRHKEAGNTFTKSERKLTAEDVARVQKMLSSIDTSGNTAKK